MAADPVRMDAFVRAIQASVRPGSVVLDLGAGTGIMSLLALRAGARRVHAVDPNPAVWLVPELARENGAFGKIVVHQASSLEMDVPEPVDVVISDMRGALPLLQDNLAALHDVQARWLAPGGIVMPLRDDLRVVLVEAATIGRRLDDAIASFDRLGFSSASVLRSVRNQAYSDSGAPLAASDVLSTAQTWATIDYRSISLGSLSGDATLEVTRGGTARGLALYFETELVPGIGYTTAPGHALVYNRLFLPFASPVDVAPHDRVRVTVRADVEGNRFGWDTTIDRAATILSTQRQATFLGAPASLESLLRGSDTSTPKLGARGECLRRLLSEMDGTKTIREITETVESGMPAERLGNVLELTKNLAIRYGV